MSDTSRSNLLLLCILVLIGLLLRSLYLDWQPLWWDEGYSAYFATEPLLQMVQLTARDIHPPLYYAALHGWIASVGSPAPFFLRLFSVIAGVAAIPLFGWMASTLFDPRAQVNPTPYVYKRLTTGSKDLGSFWHVLTHEILAKFIQIPGIHHERYKITGIGLLLFVVNPLHIYYSQEVRMYGLALLFTIWSTGSFWRLINGQPIAADSPKQPSNISLLPLRLGSAASALVSYIFATTLALYTLYYSALIPIAHLLYALAQVRIHKIESWRVLRTLVLAQIVVGLLYLPWVVYASRQLILYVLDKVGADNDTPIALPAYLGRHGIALLLGHLPIEVASLEQLSRAVGWALIILLVGALAWVGWRLSRPRSVTRSVLPRVGARASHSSPNVGASSDASILTPEANTNQAWLNPIPALWTFLLLPMALGFLLNLRLPFFPVGGERLMLIVLPYFLLLIAAGILHIRQRWLRYGVMLLLVGASAASLATFYTTQRHENRDYRGLIRYVMQQGQAEDRVLAIFPWQVGYWRAYVPTEAGGRNVGPIPQLLDTQELEAQTLEWGEALREQVDEALADSGSLWFPAPLGLGSDLPKHIEGYLHEMAADLAYNPDSTTGLLNFDADWANPTTFLTGWRLVSMPRSGLVDHEFGEVTLNGVGLEPSVVASANELLKLQLEWGGLDQIARDEYLVTLRLDDLAGRTWSQRDYGWEQGGAIAETGVELSGLLVPAGLPPGPYEVKLGLSQMAASGSGATFATIGSVEVIQPAKALSPMRLPIERPLLQGTVIDGVKFMGISGSGQRSAGEASAEGANSWEMRVGDNGTVGSGTVDSVKSEAKSDNGSNGGWILAGTELPLWIHLQNLTIQSKDKQIYLSMLDENGGGLAGWADWPLPDYPITDWPQGALIQMPAPLQLPATVPTGHYRLIAGLLDPESGEKSVPVELEVLEVGQRQAIFAPSTIDHLLRVGTARFGTHVDLLGYGLRADGDNSVQIQLSWQVEQTLLPSHHIFIHLIENAENGVPIAQGDDIPTEADGDLAPTGSWQPGEYLTTLHNLQLPNGVAVDMAAGVLMSEEGTPLHIRIGLYVAKTGVRLPVSINGEVDGDSVLLE